MASDGQGLILSSSTSLSISPLSIPDPTPSLPSGGKFLRTKMVGTGRYSSNTIMELRTGYPHLDAYGDNCVMHGTAYCRGAGIIGDDDDEVVMKDGVKTRGKRTRRKVTTTMRTMTIA